MIEGVFYESRSVSLASATETGTRYQIWKGHFDFEGVLDGMAQGRTLGKAPVGEGTSRLEGFGVYTPSARSMFPVGTKMVFESVFDFPGSDGAEFAGTMVLHGEGVRVELKLISGATQTYQGEVHND